MSVRRVCVQADRDDDPVVVDVVLPAGVAVCELMPAVVGMLSPVAASPGTARRWRLDRPCGPRLDEALSLSDNRVHDGDLLLLVSDDAPRFGPWGPEPFRTVASTAAPVADVGRALPALLCVTAAVVGALALAWAGVGTNSTANLIVAAGGACAAAGTAIVTRHAAATNVAAVALASSSGFLAVPPDAIGPNVFLAAAAGFSASVLLWRLSGRASSTMIATASFSALVAVAVLVGITVLPVATIGAVLSTAALAGLAMAPRLAILAVGLGHPDAGARGSDGHDVLTGLVVGCAGAAALGPMLVAVASPPHRGIAFATVVGLVLVLRARTYVDPGRVIALVAGGLMSGCAAVVLAVATSPAQTGWLGAILLAGGLAAVGLPELGAAATRMLSFVEYAALTAVVPVACWTGGVYALVSGAQLS